MPSRFKGTRVAITEVTLVGQPAGTPPLQVRIQFVDADGLVHASTTHRIDLGRTPALQEAARGLLDAVKSWAERLHYEDAEPDNEQEQESHGIAEALLRAAEPFDQDEGES